MVIGINPCGPATVEESRVPHAGPLRRRIRHDGLICCQHRGHNNAAFANCAVLISHYLEDPLLPVALMFQCRSPLFLASPMQVIFGGRVLHCPASLLKGTHMHRFPKIPGLLHSFPGRLELPSLTRKALCSSLVPVSLLAGTGFRLFMTDSLSESFSVQDINCSHDSNVSYRLIGDLKTHISLIIQVHSVIH